MFFKKLGLQAELLSAVTAKGYKHPTPIQSRTIPVILNGSDVLAGAHTGTGKTAAFTLPILQSLNREAVSGYGPRALILTPTRELAVQVRESVSIYGKNLQLRSAVIYGGVGIYSQIKQLRRGVDIIVATPGRLLDHTNRGTLDLSTIEILVLDEADRMLDMGFIDDIRRIIKLLPHKRQNLFFFATYSDNVKNLANSILNNPKFIEVTRRNTAVETVTQLIHPVARTEKRRLLTHLIKEGELNRVLVFTRTKHGANRLSQQLTNDGITATAIHSDKSQSARSRALADFKKGVVRILVATDIASRGLDINYLPHVINFDLPAVPEDYIHRIGRTGRAGAKGTALSLVSADEKKQLNNIQRLMGYNIHVEMISGFNMEEANLEGTFVRRRNTNYFRKKTNSSGKNDWRKWKGKSYRKWA
jgi:ATP-dependent RNA helicase RhlE